ncbi:MAG: (2Fe-2S)-binding protein [Nakamurella sp.]
MVARIPAVDGPASATQPGGNGYSPARSPAVAKGATDRAAPVPSYPVTLTINGVEHTLQLEGWVTLLDLLRDRLDLTGTKKGCDHGQCGACTVLIDGKRSLSCLILAVMRNGSEVVTVEGLADGDDLHPLQQAFIEQDAFQCGYCTPGQLCSAIGLISEGEANTDAEIRELMSGNLCRCGAYPQIVSAIGQVLRAERGSSQRDEITIVGSVPA